MSYEREHGSVRIETRADGSTAEFSDPAAEMDVPAPPWMGSTGN